MTKRFFAIITVIILLAPSLPIHADVVYGNDFFWENIDKTEWMTDHWAFGKGFIVNSPLGYVIPKEEPGSEKGIPTYLGYSGWGYGDYTRPTSDVWVFTNGTIVGVKAAYLLNGEYWGITESTHMYQHPGWVLMDDLLMLYTREDFESENKDNIYIYSNDCEAFLPAGKLVVWQWPGSDREKRIIDKEEATNLCAGNYHFYMDQKGREWVRYAGGWVCISDPANSKIPSFYPAPDPIRWSPGGSYDWSDNNTIVWTTNATEPSLNTSLTNTTTILFFVIILAAIVAIMTMQIMAVNKPKTPTQDEDFGS